MIGYVVSIEKTTLKNKYFRQVSFTGRHAQLVVMRFRTQEEIGNGAYPTLNQFFRIEEGMANYILNRMEGHLVCDGGAMVVPAGTYHNVINASATKLPKLYSIYSPPNHRDGTVHKTKAVADASEHHYSRRWADWGLTNKNSHKF